VDCIYTANVEFIVDPKVFIPWLMNLPLFARSFGKWLPGARAVAQKSLNAKLWKKISQPSNLLASDWSLDNVME